MKNIKFMIVALMATAGLLASCQNGDWDAPSTSASEAYGNNSIEETNVITISQLKAMSRYKKALSASRDTIEVTDDIQLKLRITGNDIGGNIYNYVSAQDENGDAILIYIYAGGLFSYLPVGQEILVDLKGLYVGTNGSQPAISTPYMTSSGNVYPKNMSFWLWQQHVKLLGKDENAVKVDTFTVDNFNEAARNNIEQLAGKLITIKDVVLKEADGTKKWGPKTDLASTNDFSVKRYLTGLSTNVYVNTSTSAKFASEVMPQGAIDLTCIVVRYNSYCQLTLRTADDAKKK